MNQSIDKSKPKRLLLIILRISEESALALKLFFGSAHLKDFKTTKIDPSVFLSTVLKRIMMSFLFVP